MNRLTGFTLMEMLVALAILGILMSFAIPTLPPTAVRQNVNESLKLMDTYKANINLYYTTLGRFPADNSQAAMPEANRIIGNFITSAEQEDGAIHLHFGNKIQPPLMERVLSIQPVYVEGSPQSPISWICGYDPVPDGMRAGGENRTDIENKYLPAVCRR